MSTGRSATSIIWRTVVCAGAMLAAPACFGGGGTRTVCDPPEQQAAMAPSQPAPLEVVSAGEPVPAGAATIALAVTSEPPGAEVHVDGVAVGVTPVQISRPSVDAELTIRVSRDGYRDEQRRVRADRDQALALTLVEAVASRPRCYPVRTGRGFVLS